MRNDQTSRIDSGRLSPAMPGDPSCCNIYSGVAVAVLLAAGRTREYVTPAYTEHSASCTGLRSVRIGIGNSVCHSAQEGGCVPPNGIVLGDVSRSSVRNNAVGASQESLGENFAK